MEDKMKRKDVKDTRITAVMKETSRQTSLVPFSEREQLPGDACIMISWSLSLHNWICKISSVKKSSESL